MARVAQKKRRTLYMDWEIKRLVARFYLAGAEGYLLSGNETVSSVETNMVGEGLGIARQWLSREQLATVWALVRLTRPLSSVVAGALSATAVISGSGHDVLRGVAAGLAMTILTMFGFVVNDLFDRRKDAAAGVQRPIATGEISVRTGILFAMGLLLPVFLLSKFIGAGASVLVITCLALVAYSPLAYRYPAGKGLLVAGLACLPMVYGAVVTGVEFLGVSYVTLACFVLGREMLMDSEEFVGDRLAGMETIAAVLGRKRARKAGTILMFVSASCVVALARNDMDRIAAVSALITLMWVFLWPDLSDERRIQLSRFPMLLGAVAIAIAN